jgi:glycosyltransferase involved in cell wall biosynthesis
MDKKLPFVSICTPTFNRRPFIQSLIYCFKNQTYPKENMEWIIIDDGTDSVEDIFNLADIPNLKYIYLKEKITLGKKRNLLNKYAKGKIIVNMDDDDYYPPSRVSHAVEMLLKNPYIMVASSSLMYMYYTLDNTIVSFGPYGKNHGTGATLAYRKEYAQLHQYSEVTSISEEKEFLNHYNTSVIQLNSMKTILVIAHGKNTVDKDLLIAGNTNNKTIKRTNLKLEKFISQPFMVKFYKEMINNIINNYKLGNLSEKPETKLATKKIQERVRDSLGQSRGIYVNQNNRKKWLSEKEVIQILNNNYTEIERLKKVIQYKR